MAEAVEKGEVPVSTAAKEGSANLPTPETHVSQAKAAALLNVGERVCAVSGQEANLPLETQTISLSMAAELLNIGERAGGGEVSPHPHQLTAEPA